uniref:4-coumarateCoA ligase-like 6 n=1 Tax=Rhizophora mucronata TaxID=61149 RepID=A0A2P2K0Y7_RHIMU
MPLLERWSIPIDRAQVTQFNLLNPVDIYSIIKIIYIVEALIVMSSNF